MKRKTILLSLSLALCFLLGAVFLSCGGDVPSDTDAAGDTGGDTVPESESTVETQNDPNTGEDKYNIPVSGDYVLLFEDEFTGDALNTSVWRYRTDTKYNGENRPANVSVQNDKLLLRFKKEGKVYTGGGIISQDLFGYGYYETKCKLFADGGGLHSAFWLMGGSGNGSILPIENTVLEIDGFEFDSHKPTTISFNMNYKIGENYGNVEYHTVKSVAHHDVTVGFEWLPDRINWYMDGELMRTVTGETEPLVYAQQAIWVTALANTVMSGKINDSLLPTASEFSYVRYYAKSLKDVNLIGNAGFEYNDNTDFTEKVEMQTPLSYCEKGSVAASVVERIPDAYAGNAVLAHRFGDVKAYKVSTIQKLFHIPNGTYTLSAWVRSSGGQKACYLSASETGTDTVKVEIPASAEWTYVSLSGVKVTDNYAVITVYSDANPGNWLQVDELSFASEEGETVEPCRGFVNRTRESRQLGEIYLNSDMDSFSSSDWSASSVMGEERSSKYKLKASENDYAMWTLPVPTDGEYEVWFYNVSSSGKVSKQALTVSADGAKLAEYTTGAAEGWEDLGRVSLRAGTSLTVRTGVTKENIGGTARVDSVKLVPVDSIAYKDTVILSVGDCRAYVHGVQTRVNDTPAPEMRDGVLYLPKAWLEKTLSVTLSGTDAYVPADALTGSGYRADTDGKTVVICPSDRTYREQWIASAATLF